MKAFKTIGLLGLAITTVLNLVALLFFKRASAEYFSEKWWAEWFTSYIVWVSFVLIGFACHSKSDLRPSRPSGLWLMLLLLLAALVPSVCLLWFMNQAVRNERLAARQKLVDAYSANLSLESGALETFWRQTASALDAEAIRLSAPALFAKQVRAGLAEAAICFDPADKVAYPGPAPAPEPHTLPTSWLEAERMESPSSGDAADAFARLAEQATNAIVAARALQAEARCLVKAAQTNAAIGVLTGPLEEARYRQATDAQGRLIVPNAELIALELLKAPDD
jgi:hypothetical protein